MNFLAHLYLSGNDADLMIGNFIADSVKGKSYAKFKPKIQKGILLHRKIDVFTDTHPITKELKSKLSSGYNKHSGIVIDIFYDHFLSVNWDKFSSIPLDYFIKTCHRNILRNIFILPSEIKAYLPFFIVRRRLKSYSRIEGIENVLETMSKYTSLPAASGFAMDVLQSNYSEFNNSFELFFAEMTKMVSESIDQH
jgi:acyl carrier protein phosphodiesterase